jgi:molybdenum cofactor cytidylyltransferase
MSSEDMLSISAIVVAGGLSTRMGAPKQLLPYGKHTVVEQIVSVLLKCSLDEIVVVTGHKRHAVETRLAAWSVRPVFNSNYQAGEMLSSVKCGLAALDSEVNAALLVLGDQPQLETAAVQQLIATYQTEPAGLVIPSFQMRRGHPILIDRDYWPEILTLDSNRTLRDVIVTHDDEICYVAVETDSVLRDIDTPEDYQQELQQLDIKKPPGTREHKI